MLLCQPDYYKYHSPFRMRSSNFITTSVPLLDLQLSPFGSIFIVLKIKLLFSHPSLCPTKVSISIGDRTLVDLSPEDLNLHFGFFCCKHSFSSFFLNEHS